MNTPVNFEIAKLLRDKEYNLPCNYFYSDVIMWLYEKHGIWIYVLPSRYGKLDKFMGWIIVPSNGTTRDHSTKDFNSPTEAYSAAIDYTLKNLI